MFDQYRKFVQVHCDLSVATGFPGKSPVTYDDYLALRNQDSDTLYMRTMFRFPDVVKEWEESVLARK